MIFDYRSSGLEIFFDGNVVDAIPTDVLSIKLSEKTYRLQKMQFHTPSDHRLEGEVYDGEIQLFHEDSDGQIVAISILVLEGQTHPVFGRMLEKLPRSPGGKASMPSFDFRKLLPDKKGYIRYSGSLTTPPCKEGVTWLVMTRNIQMSGFQLDQLEISHGKNNRPIQSLGQRIPLRSSDF